MQLGIWFAIECCFWDIKVAKNNVRVAFTVSLIFLPFNYLGMIDADICSLKLNFCFFFFIITRFLFSKKIVNIAIISSHNCETSISNSRNNVQLNIDICQMNFNLWTINTHLNGKLNKMTNVFAKQAHIYIMYCPRSGLDRRLCGF